MFPLTDLDVYLLTYFLFFRATSFEFKCTYIIAFMIALVDFYFYLLTYLLGFRTTAIRFEIYWRLGLSN